MPNLHLSTKLSQHQHDNIYVVDGGDVWRVSSGGKMRLLADQDLCGFLGGIAVDKSGDVFVTCEKENAIMEIRKDGSTIALGGSWDAPSAITIDGGGDLYIVTGSAANSIYEYTVSGNTVQIAPDYRFGYIAGIASGGGNLYVTDNSASKILQVSPSSDQ